MSKPLWVKPLFTIPVIFAAFLIFSTGQVSGKGAYAPQAKEKMDKIINLQTETLQRLFAQEEKIAAMGKEKERIARDIEILNRQIADLQSLIAEEEMACEKNSEALKQFFRGYQRMGPGSYLGIILESDNLTDFLRRVNILRNMTGNTGKIIEQLQWTKEKQTADRRILTDELTALRGKQVHFDELLAKEKQLKRDLEDNLAALAEERAKYEKYLADLRNKWDGLKPLFSSVVKEFSRLIEGKKLPPDSFKLAVNFPNINGSTTDKALNEIIAGNPAFPHILFSFKNGNVEMKMPDKSLVLDGTFVIHEGSALKFQVKEGSFYGIPLETDALKDLFREGDLMINLKSLLGGYTLSSVETVHGYLQFSISPEF